MSQINRAALKALADQIRDETQTGGNTRERVATVLENLADSLLSILDDTNPNFTSVVTANGQGLKGKTVGGTTVPLCYIGTSDRLYFGSPSTWASISNPQFFYSEAFQLFQGGIESFRIINGNIEPRAGGSIGHALYRFTDAHIASTVYIGTGTAPTEGSVRLDHGASVSGKTSAGATVRLIRTAPGNDAIQVGSIGTSSLVLMCADDWIFWDATTNLERYRINSSYAAPTQDNRISCGASGRRYTVVWAATGTISTSDAREKTELCEVTDDVLDAWGDVQWGTYQWLEAIQSKGDLARIHVGLITQKVEAAFAARGLDATRYGLFCFDRWDEEWSADPKVVEERAEQVHACETALEDAARTRIRLTEAESELARAQAITEGETALQKALRHERLAVAVDALASVALDAEAIDERRLKQELEVAQAALVAAQKERVIKTREAGDSYGLRYTQCLALEAAYQRRRADRIEARIAALEGAKV